MLHVVSCILAYWTTGYIAGFIKEQNHNNNHKELRKYWVAMCSSHYPVHHPILVSQWMVFQCIITPLTHLLYNCWFLKCKKELLGQSSQCMCMHVYLRSRGTSSAVSTWPRRSTSSALQQSLDLSIMSIGHHYQGHSFYNNIHHCNKKQNRRPLTWSQCCRQVVKKKHVK